MLTVCAKKLLDQGQRGDTSAALQLFLVIYGMTFMRLTAAVKASL